MSPPPNVLFLMSDEHRPDVAGFAGDPVVQTPYLDALARDGAVLTNAYTAAPTCVPARQCLMAGQLPKTCGVTRFQHDLEPGHMTFARRFSQWGYITAACGKLHHTGPDQMQGWRRRVAGDTEIRPQYIDGLQEDLERRYSEGQRGSWSAAREVDRAGAGRHPYRVEDDLTVQGAVDFIERYFLSPFYDRQRGHRPLLLKVSLRLPHYPFLTDLTRFNYYLNRVAPNVDPPSAHHPAHRDRLVPVGETVSEREVRRATAAYYGMVETVDAQFGRVLQALEHAGQDLDDWIIIYTSDHGEHLGQRGLWFKQTFYEESVGVPLVIRWPREIGLGLRLDANVSLCDLFATLCELCRIPAPDGLDSCSFAPLLKGNGMAEWSHEVVAHIYTAGENVMIKRDQLKYQYYEADWPEVLYDLAADPGETVNCIDEPAYREAVRYFRRRREELGYGSG